MSEQEKSFIQWLSEDFAPAVRAAKKAFEPYAIAVGAITLSAHKAFNRFLIENQETIQIWQQFARVYPLLQPYLDNMKAGLDDPEFEIANDVIRLAHLFAAIDLEKDVESVSILTVISSHKFQNSLTDLYSNLSLDQLRLPLIEEALTLHNQGSYAGSICLLYSLIEGVLTESFEKASYIAISAKKVSPINPDGSLIKKVNLTGLTSKLDHAITHKDQLQTYYQKIKCYELVNGDPEQTIPKTRNKILHGSALEFNSEKRSAQLILWLYSTILHVQALGI